MTIFKKITNQIEKQRNSKIFFWISLIIIKDSIWKLTERRKIKKEAKKLVESSHKNIDLKEKPKIYCMFVGYPRSGHSLVGSLLDAHPNVVISNEADVLKLIEYNLTKEQIYRIIINNSMTLGKEGRMGGGDYDYTVANQWQGRYKELLVIGDKKGGGSTQRIKNNFRILKKLRKIIGIPVKYIHVIRNPFDNITTISKRNKISIEEAIDVYFDMAKTNYNIGKMIDRRLFIELRHEDLIKDPKNILRMLCEFLELEAKEDYLTDCANIIYQKPHKSRYEGDWTLELINKVKEKMENYPFLEGYSYE